MKEFRREQVTLSLHNDSQSAIDLANNPVYHDITKRIDVRYHFIRILLKDSVLSLVKIHTNQNSTDMLTKVVTTLGEFGVSGRWQGRSDRAFQSGGVFRAEDHSEAPNRRSTPQQSPERKVTPKYLVGGALCSGVSGAEDHSETPSRRSTNEAT